MLMESLQQRAEAWIREQRAKISNVPWPSVQWRTVGWPWKNYGEKRKKIQEEYERRKKQVRDLCLAVKADSVSDLRDILCSMVLSECVYKRPASEVVWAVNKFKADFGGQIVSLERVQPSSDHVPHRYLLAEAGDTLFASFIGTKQYKDMMADANILQGAVFHDEAEEYIDVTKTTGFEDAEAQKSIPNSFKKPININSKQANQKPKPAAHRGFLARAKGIPALELYRLAQKKKRKLVLCGHSLGGAVAVLATLAILRVVAASPSLKDTENVQVKCITFSQPPVGNAALRDYVNGKGWQHYFKTYCIPEDLVPRILSPAYFHHYNAQALSMLAESGPTSVSRSKHEKVVEKSARVKLKENDGEQLVLGFGPVQRSFWRLSNLVPLESFRQQFNRYGGRQVDSVEKSLDDSALMSSIDNAVDQPQPLEIQEGSDSISLKPIPDTNEGPLRKLGEKGCTITAENGAWRRVPYLPSYVPFGQLYLLGNSSVESLSGPEYSQLTSVRSVITELRERLQSHSMKSYRSRFQRIYDVCMSDNTSSVLGMEEFPYLQQWFGLSLASAVELGHIVDCPVISTATSVVPLGWSGIPGQKNGELLKVDITGFGLHLCTLVQAQVNGNWCSTTVESFPPAPNYFSSPGLQQNLQTIRVLIGPQLRRPPKHEIATDALMAEFSTDPNTVNFNSEHHARAGHDEKFVCPDDLRDLVVFCTSDFATVSKEVHIRTRRVKLIGLEGAGKTSLLNAIVGQSRIATNADSGLQHEDDLQEGISGGLCYSDSAGVNLQRLNMEALLFKDELLTGIHDLSKKIDLIVLVHNLSHKIPRYNRSEGSNQEPVLSLFLNEAKALGIPWVLAITNKFSVSAHQQKPAIEAVLWAYKVSPDAAGVVNSCPYVMPSAGGDPISLGSENSDSDGKNAQKLHFGSFNIVRWPFQKKEIIFPIEGMTGLCHLIHRVLQGHEEASLQELARDRLLLELAWETNAKHGSKANGSSLTAATVGASLGAGLGVILAVVMGAASALRKP